jgi:hypothetical protein
MSIQNALVSYSSGGSENSPSQHIGDLSICTYSCGRCEGAHSVVHLTQESGLCESKFFYSPTRARKRLRILCAPVPRSNFPTFASRPHPCCSWPRCSSLPAETTAHSVQRSVYKIHLHRPCMRFMSFEVEFCNQVLSCLIVRVLRTEERHDSGCLNNKYRITSSM